eukprot:3338044-Amphidinium_carterae.1
MHSNILRPGTSVLLYIVWRPQREHKCSPAAAGWVFGSVSGGAALPGALLVAAGADVDESTEISTAWLGGIRSHFGSSRPQKDQKLRTSCVLRRYELLSEDACPSSP